MLSGQPIMFGVDPLGQSEIQEHPLGAIGVDNYGDLYRYSNFEGAAAAGQLMLAPAPKTNHHNCALAVAAAVGARRVTVDMGNTAVVVNEYAGGYMIVSDAAGEGVTYRVVGNKAASADANCEFELEYPLIEALTTSSEVTFVHNHWNQIGAAAATRRPAGVPLRDFTDEYFGWVKTRGIVSCLAAGAITVNNACISDGTTAGAVKASNVLTEATDASRLDDEYIVGRALVAGVDTEYRPIDLCID